MINKRKQLLDTFQNARLQNKTFWHSFTDWQPMLKTDPRLQQRERCQSGQSNANRSSLQMFTQHLPSRLYLTRTIALFFQEYRNLNFTKTPPLLYVIKAGQKRVDFDTLTLLHFGDQCANEQIRKKPGYKQELEGFLTLQNTLVKYRNMQFRTLNCVFILGFRFVLISYTQGSESTGAGLKLKLCR